jgi:hypothetical protein
MQSIHWRVLCWWFKRHEASLSLIQG